MSIYEDMLPNTNPSADKAELAQAGRMLVHNLQMAGDALFADEPTAEVTAAALPNHAAHGEPVIHARAAAERLLGVINYLEVLARRAAAKDDPTGPLLVNEVVHQAWTVRRLLNLAVLSGGGALIRARLAHRTLMLLNTDLDALVRLRCMDAHTGLTARKLVATVDAEVVAWGRAVKAQAPPNAGSPSAGR